MTAPKQTKAQKRIATLRNNGWTVVQICEELGCSVRCLYNWINGESPSASSMEALLAIPNTAPKSVASIGRPLGRKATPK